MDAAAVEDHVISILGDRFPGPAVRTSRALAPDVGHDTIVQTGDQTIRIDVKDRSLIDEGQALSLGRRPSSSVDLTLYVADRIVERARRELSSMGASWLDLRGHLHLVAPGLLVDAVSCRTPRRGHPGAPGPAASP